MHRLPRTGGICAKRCFKDGQHSSVLVSTSKRHSLVVCAWRAAAKALFIARDDAAL